MNTDAPPHSRDPLDLFDRVLCGREIRGIAGALPPSIDQEALARAAQLPYPLAEVPLEKCDEDASHRLWRAIMQSTSDLTLPLTIGAKLPFGTYEVVDYLTSACATVGSALETLARYFGLITPMFRWEWDGTTEPPRMSLISSYEGPQDNLVFIQYIFGVAMGRVHTQTEGPVTCLDVQLAIPPLPSSEPHERFFGCPVRYGTEFSQMVFSRDTWNAPLVRRESGLKQILEQHAQVMMQRIRTQDLNMASVRIAIQGQLADGPPKLEQIAKSIATSSRTLQRRLREANTSFQALVDEERAAAAHVYLHDPHLTTNEIAYLLGYSEPSAFARAFRRWTGQSPTEFRMAS